MAITAQEVKKLREMTGAGMMDCKKALTEAGGDFDKAIENLRKKGQKLSEKRADRETTEGTVFIKTNAEQTEAYLVSLTCETDFVAKNEDFQKMGNTIIDMVAEQKPADIEALKAMPMDGLTVQEKLVELIGKIGEKLEISDYETISGEKVVSYVHAGSKLGVLVALKNVGSSDADAAGRDVAMQIAAMNPVALDKEGVDSSVIEKEIEIGKETARQEGKPEEMLEKIAQGKLNKFFKENTLLSQAFVKDNKVTILQYLDSVNKGMTVVEFKRVAIG